MLLPRKLRKPVAAAALSAALLLSVAPFQASAASAVPTADTTLTFTDTGITASGQESGYKISGSDLTINAAGTYAVTGSCSDGTITVKKGTTGVTLILDDLTLASSSSAPLSLNKTTETVLYVTGSNTLTDKEDPTNEDSADEEVADAFEGAAIKVKSGASVEITGDGTLTADGSACKNGIKGAATAAITVDGDVTLNVKAANNGLASDGSVEVDGGTVNITAGNDGIKAEPDEDDADSAGTVTVKGGKLTISTQGDGIQATNDLTITGGDFSITTFGGYTKAKSLGEDSAKAIKSDSQVSITGGTFTLNSADDAIHSNGDVSVTGGSFQISTGDDAIHADNDMALDQLDLTVATCYEGVEGARVYLNGGTGVITASDDGVNAATDLSVNEIAIYLNGGTWNIDASGDGLDAGGDSRNNSGGNIYVNGGVTKVFGAANGGNAGLDYDGSCAYNGGTLLVVDYSGMNQVPTSGTYVFFGNGGMGGQMGQPGDMGQSGQMGQPGDMGQDGQMGQPGNMNQNGQMGQPGDMGQSGQMGQPGDMGQSGQMGQPGDMGQSGQMGQPGGRDQNGGVGPFATTTETGVVSQSVDAGRPGDMNQSGGMGQPGDMNQSGGVGQPGEMGGMEQTTGSAFTISKGSTIEVKDGDGNTVITATGTKTANCVTLCDDSLVAGQTYTLYVDGTAVATATASTGSDQSGGMGNLGGMGQNQQPGGQQTTGGNTTGNATTGSSTGTTTTGSGTGNTTDNTTTGNTTGNTTGDTTGNTTTGNTGTPFQDVSDNAWYQPSVDYVYRNKIMNGVSDTQFAPAMDLTRGMMVQVLYNLEGRPAVDGKDSFSDVDANAWYADAAAWAKENGIVSGYGNGQFGPNDSITRAQTAVILQNYANYKGQDTGVTAPLNFSDAGSIPDWAGNAMEWGVGQKIFQGSGGQLSPNNTANRAEIATMMMRFLEQGK